MKNLLYRMLLLTCLSFSIFTVSHQDTYLQISKEESFGTKTFESYKLPDLPSEH